MDSCVCFHFLFLLQSEWNGMTYIHFIHHYHHHHSRVAHANHEKRASIVHNIYTTVEILSSQRNCTEVRIPKILVSIVRLSFYSNSFPLFVLRVYCCSLSFSPSVWMFVCVCVLCFCILHVINTLAISKMDRLCWF